MKTTNVLTELIKIIPYIYLMVLVYFANSTVIQQLYPREQLLQQLPMDMWPKALRYRQLVDSYNYILGRMMLKSGISELGLKDSKFSELYFNKFEKPLIKGISFSISHSQSMVICALSKSVKVGIDIEVDQRLKLADLQSFFTEKEWQDIQNASNQKMRFYQYWTRKESILKAIGTGLAKLEDIHLLDETQGYHKSQNNLWYFHELNLGVNSTTTLCTSEVSPEIKLAPLRIKL